MSIDLTVDEYIDLFNRLSSMSKKEVGEQDTTGGTSTGSGKSPTKRFDIESPARGVANPLGNTKRFDTSSPKRGVANTLF